MSKRKKKQPAEWVTTRTLANEYNIPTTSIARGLQEGRIPKQYVKKENRRWYVRKDGFDKHWFANIDPANVRDPGNKKKMIALLGDKKSDGDDDPHMDDDFGSLADIFINVGLNDETLLLLRRKLGKLGAFGVRAAKDAADVIKKEIEIAQLRGQLIHKDEAYKELFDFGARVRNRLEAVPNRVIDDILAADDRVEAVAVLAASIDEALLELARTPELENR